MLTLLRHEHYKVVKDQDEHGQTNEVRVEVKQAATGGYIYADGGLYTKCLSEG